MLRRTFLIFAVLSALFLIGCGTTSNNNNSIATDNKNTSASTPATTTTTTNPSTTTSGEKIGIAECDDFIAKYDACVTANVPEAQRAQYKESLNQWRDTWRKLAENPLTKATLTAACKQAAEQAKTSMKSYNCNF